MSDSAKMYKVLDPAIQHQAALNAMLECEKWDAKTKREVAEHVGALNGLMNRIVRFKSDAPDVVESIKTVMAKVDDKLAGRPVVFEEFINPEMAV